MVRINELRTGNKLMYDNRVIEVMGIHKSGRIFSNSDGYIDGDNLYPLSLSRGWLLDFGFDEIYTGLYKFQQLTEIFNVLNEFFFRYDGKIIASCKYVHELQNIFFALYNEEILSGSSAFFSLNHSTILQGESFFIEKKPEIQIN